jgi:hypothetical protein
VRGAASAISLREGYNGNQSIQHDAPALVANPMRIGAHGFCGTVLISRGWSVYLRTAAV